MANITRKDIANYMLRIGVEIDPIQALDYVNQIVDILVKKISSGEDILIFNFGKFFIRHKRQRIGRNPRTGDQLTISPRRVVAFRPSPAFRKKVQKNA